MVVMKAKTFKVDDFVSFRGSLGIVREVKVVRVPEPMNDYNLFKVEFEDEPGSNDKRFEWINGLYLVKR